MVGSKIPNIMIKEFEYYLLCQNVSSTLYHHFTCRCPCIILITFG